MDIKLYLKRPDAKAETSIFARITYEAGPFKYYLPEKIKPQYWNNNLQRAARVKDFPEYSEFNARLDNLEKVIKDSYRKYLNDHNNEIPSLIAFKDVLDYALGKKMVTKWTFLDFFKDFIARCDRGERISPKTKKVTVKGTNKGYTVVLNHLEEFQLTYSRKIDFETIDLVFYNDYLKYLTNKAKLSLNTIGNHVKHIKTVLREARSRNINVNPNFESEYFTKPSEETDSVYLNQSELDALLSIDLSSNIRLEKVRDLFIVGCYTGLRYSDYSVIEPGHIKDGFIVKKQQKQGKEVVIPVHPIVQKLISKYGGKLPESISNQKSNDYLKEIGKKVEVLKVPITITFTKGGEAVSESNPKYNLITTHTARRSFATNEYLAGTPILTIMAITGHKTEKAFLKYIKLTPNDHAKLLKLQWEKRQTSVVKLRMAQ